MLQFVHGINRILHLPFSYSVCIVFRDCLVLRKCYLLRFQANASRGCQRRGWHVPHPWFCSATDKPLDVSLLEGKASCCAGGQTARQCKVHFGVCWASGTQSLGSCISQHRGLKCVHGGYTISFCLNCWKSSFMLFSQCSPSKAECVMLFGLIMLVCYWWQNSVLRKLKGNQGSQLSEAVVGGIDRSYFRSLQHLHLHLG